MTATQAGLAISVFLACMVEAVEAATIVLAVGSARSWRSAFYGLLAALVCLVLLTVALGPALTAIPLNTLRVVVGALLLIFGLQWLRKAILRFSGLRALHDEDESFAEESERARDAPSVSEREIDRYSFLIAFKGSLLEGLEVVFIVLTFGANQHDIPLAAIAAALAVLVVAGAGLAIRAPLSRVPENTMKFIVGIMLTSFGMFWGVEGAGARWPGGDASLLGLIPAVAVFAVALVSALKHDQRVKAVAR